MDHHRQIPNIYRVAFFNVLSEQLGQVDTVSLLPHRPTLAALFGQLGFHGGGEAINGGVIRVWSGLLLSHPLAGLPEHGTLRSCGCTPYLVLSAQRLESGIIVGGTLADVLGARLLLCGLRGEIDW